ncbi:MAG: long-chain fatty acid--CoA ligase [Candidatus Omnitrophica bacterium]|nr:long-chain fatty acid--CoA ligase [Candidatus Omnitrophota bacterium]
MNPPWQTIPQMVFAQAKRLGDRTALRAKRSGIYRDISWNELQSHVRKLALSLIDLGVHPQDRVGLLSENRPEWAFADLGILAAGAVTVPIYTTLTAEEIEYILQNAQARLLFVSSPELMTKVLPLQLKMDLKVVLFDAPYRVAGPRVWWLGELIGLGETAGPKVREELESRLANSRPEDVVSIIYTSGTTGHPKGVMLTHRNFLSNCAAIAEVLPITEKDSTLSFLPLSHVFERCAGYYFVLSVGGSVAYAENMETVPTNLLEIKPTILTAVPRFYEKMHERVQESVRAASVLKRWIFHWAVRVERGSPLYGLADHLVFSKLRARLGGRLRFCISGSAPLSKELSEFFYRAGVLILEGYGLTETSPVITANRPEKFRFGSVGLPLPGVEVRIAEDGEILTRGPHVMKGYFNNPEATAEAIDSDGWFHTGDIGNLSPEGFLTITDRKKDMIKTSGGKMVAPQNLENALKSDPLIADCVVIGDRRKYISALIVPAESILHHPEAEKMVQERIDRLNEKLASFEQIKKFTLLPEPFSLQAGELTPTLKVKRRVVAEKYSAQIESMYFE